MWIVALALRRPYTFVVMALVIILLTPITILRTPTDIFPNIDIPVVSVVWFYTGMSPQDMADRIVANSERGITTTVNDIEHMESQSVNGLGVIKVFFRPGTNVQRAIAQITAISQTTVRGLPPGTTPPLIISYSASTTPIIQLGLSSKTLPEQQLFDLGQNFLRNFLATVPGAATPYPYGGKIRQIQVDLDLPKLQAYGLAPIDIVNAVNAQNLILPTGTVKLGPLEYNVEMNGTPQTIAELNDLPVKTANGSTLYMRDVAHIRDGFAPQTNIVRQDGNRGALMSIYKNGNASTLQIVAGDQEHCCAGGAVAAAGAEDHLAVRSVAVCARLHPGRGARGADRRGSDRRDDPYLSRRLAPHDRHIRFRFRSPFLFRSSCWAPSARPSTS